MVEIVKGVLPNWLKRPYREITQDDVLVRFDVGSRMLAEHRRDGKPAPITRTINQHFKYLQAAYKDAISKHRLAGVGFSNPVAILRTARRWNRMNRRSGFLETTKPYFVKWWFACEALKPVEGDYSLFTLITASRSVESATLRWSTDVDFKKNEVTFRDTRNGQSYTFSARAAGAHDLGATLCG
ncbi:hypothetical protein [Xanthomonas sacchari]|uniref:hypothetical protein n=1 Tax=Xanthomonas sacchari TaxID=56458 RepID=UPI0020C50120|nr:hypothetical protein [Xanthomonas sacchari]